MPAIDGEGAGVNAHSIPSVLELDIRHGDEVVLTTAEDGDTAVVARGELADLLACDLDAEA